jgi:hypothetical protein
LVAATSTTRIAAAGTSTWITTATAGRHTSTTITAAGIAATAARTGWARAITTTTWPATTGAIATATGIRRLGALHDVLHDIGAGTTHCLPKSRAALRERIHQGIADDIAPATPLLRLCEQLRRL